MFKMNIKINPSQEQVASWIKKYVPEKDLFFLREEDLVTFEAYLNCALVVPRDEYRHHASYTQIQITNSYESFRISRDAQFVIVARPEWITNLAPQDKEDLFRIQIRMGRGLIFPVSIFSNPDVLPSEYIVEEKGVKNLILQNDYVEKASVFQQSASDSSIRP